MKYAYVMALFLVVLMVGCAPKETPPAAPPAAPATPPAAVPEEPAAPAEEPLPEGDIKITKEGLEPSELTINEGDTVTWVNAADRIHALGAPVLSGQIAVGKTFSKKFDKAGEYVYLDIISKKQGKIIVKAAVTTGAEG